MARTSYSPDDGMFFVAKRHVDVAPSDRRYVGDKVPEAFSWTKTASLISLGILRFITNGERPPAIQPEQRPSSKQPVLAPATEPVPPAVAGAKHGAPQFRRGGK
jgi:hypothetical protein